MLIVLMVHVTRAPARVRKRPCDLCRETYVTIRLESPCTVAAIEQTPHPTDYVEDERQVEWVGQLHHPRQLIRAPAGLCHSLQEQTTEAICPKSNVAPARVAGWA